MAALNDYSTFFFKLFLDLNIALELLFCFEFLLLLLLSLWILNLLYWFRVDLLIFHAFFLKVGYRFFYVLLNLQKHRQWWLRINFVSWLLLVKSAKYNGCLVGYIFKCTVRDHFVIYIWCLIFQVRFLPHSFLSTMLYFSFTIFESLDFTLQLALGLLLFESLQFNLLLVLLSLLNQEQIFFL